MSFNGLVSERIDCYATADTLESTLRKLHGLKYITVSREEQATGFGFVWDITFPIEPHAISLMVATDLSLTATASLSTVTRQATGSLSLQGTFAIELQSDSSQTDMMSLDVSGCLSIYLSLSIAIQLFLSI